MTSHIIYKMHQHTTSRMPECVVLHGLCVSLGAVRSLECCHEDDRHQSTSRRITLSLVHPIVLSSADSRTVEV